jgi:predicted transposase YbfD/YdcC
MSSMLSVSLIEHFSTLPDPRIERTKRHKLLDIIGIAICGVICGAEGWTDIEDYGHAKESWLRQFFELPNGIPSHDTIGRVLARLSPSAFQQRFSNWIQAIHQQTAGQVVPIDGKTLCQSYESATDKAAIHMVSAWAGANHLVLGQVKTSAKSNEITAIPELLEVLALTGCIVTIDAMGCQTEIAAQIVAQGADYVLALKGNQDTSYRHVVDLFSRLQEPTTAPEPADAQESSPTSAPEDVPSAPFPGPADYETIEKDHGRIEIRRYWQVTDLTGFAERSRWKHLQSVGMVEAERHIGDQVSRERRYYLSTLPQHPQRFAEAVRGHWGIENSVHWILDVVFHEDACRIRHGHAPENFAVLRHIALNVLRQETSYRRGIAGKRKRAGWDDTYMTHLLFPAED